MRWSWKLGRIAGIDIYMHATFILLIGWVAIEYWMRGRNLQGILSGVAFILVLFGCVVLHEFGHALAARRYGIATRDITLLPIGGVARLERMPENPQQELRVALAGPAVSLAIAAALFVGLQVQSALQPITVLSVAGGSFFQRLMVINVFLALFNLLPAFPMDGGRVLRALLATRMEYTQATQTAAAIGQGMALLLGFLGLLINPFLLFIALFVWIGASQEASMVQVKSALAGIPIAKATITDFRTLSPEDPLTRAVALTLAGSQQDFPVVQHDHVVGVLTRSNLLVALAHGGHNRLVADVMQQQFQVAESSEMLETVFQRLQTCECHTLPVLHKQQLVGLVTMDNVGEFLMIQAALHNARTCR